MNEGIKLINIVGRMTNIRPASNYGRRGRRLDALLKVSVTKENKDKRDALSFSFHPDLIEQMGVVLGDRLDLEVGKSEWSIFRDPKGWRLYQSYKAKKARAYLKLSFMPGFLDGVPTGTCRNIKALPGRVSFELPAEE